MTSGVKLSHYYLLIKVNERRVLNPIQDGEPKS